MRSFVDINAHGQHVPKTCVYFLWNPRPDRRGSDTHTPDAAGKPVKTRVGQVQNQQSTCCCWLSSSTYVGLCHARVRCLDPYVQNLGFSLHQISTAVPPPIPGYHPPPLRLAVVNGNEVVPAECHGVLDQHGMIVS